MIDIKELLDTIDNDYMLQSERRLGQLGKIIVARIAESVNQSLRELEEKLRQEYSENGDIYLR